MTILATATCLVRPARVEPVRPDFRSYEDILSEDLGRALDEIDRLKASLQRSSAALASASGQIKRHDAALEKARGEIQALKARLPEPAPPRRPSTSGSFKVPRRFPLALEERTGLAAAILEPLPLRSGAVLDPLAIAVTRDECSLRVPGTSWLVLCALVQARQEWVTRPALDAATGMPNATRAAVHRVLGALKALGSEGDLEIDGQTRDRRWRLLLGEER